MTGRTYRVRLGEREYTVRIVDEKGDTVRVEVEGQIIEVRVEEETESHRHQTTVATRPEVTVPAGKPTPTAQPTTMRMPEPPSPPAGGKVIKSSVPGKVVEVLKGEGQEVRVNETVLKMESMKMIIEVKSPFEGRVRKVMVKPGDYVNPGAPLIELE